jgi:hypothetical protein
MNRDNLIKTLVERKLSSNQVRSFCVCMARQLCFGGAQKAPPVQVKK